MSCSYFDCRSSRGVEAPEVIRVGLEFAGYDLPLPNPGRQRAPARPGLPRPGLHDARKPSRAPLEDRRGH